MDEKTTVRDKDAQWGLRVAETEIDLLGVGRSEKEYLVGDKLENNSCEPKWDTVC